MDLTPHLVTGATLAVRVKPPGAAIVCVIMSHFVLDAIPHFHIVWFGGRVLFEATDVGLGLLLTGVIAWRAKRMWPFVGAAAAILPDAPGLREYWGLPMSSILPHPTWDPPWGIVTQVVVAGVAFLWGMRIDVKRAVSSSQWAATWWRVRGVLPAPSGCSSLPLALRRRPRPNRLGGR